MDDPRPLARRRADEAAPSVGSTRGRGRLVLVVDDEPDILLLHRLNLTTAGFRVILGADGEQLLQRARAERPDLVVSDISEPVLDGWGSLALLRADPAIAETPFVFCTARSAEADVARGFALGADGYLCKPFDAAHLVDLVCDLLDRSPDDLARARAQRTRARTRAVAAPAPARV